VAVEKRTEFEIDHKFDSKKSRHYLNGVCSVLHCHHYATLYTQLAMDAVDFEGIRHLVENSEDVLYGVLEAYYTDNGVTSVEDKIEIAQQYWQAVGMGLITFTGIGKYEVTAEMDYSHLDEGWLKKWGGGDQPVNFFTVGFVAAVAALATNRPPRSFQAKEVKGLVCGDDKSEFKAVLR
jgi:hypothetical protein